MWASTRSVILAHPELGDRPPRPPPSAIGHGYWPGWRVLANRALESVPAPALVPSGHDLAGGDELFKRAAEGPIGDLGAHPTKDVALRRVREALEILENERP